VDTNGGEPVAVVVVWPQATIVDDGSKVNIAVNNINIGIITEFLILLQDLFFLYNVILITVMMLVF
jgi:hypothetical protein